MNFSVPFQGTTGITCLNSTASWSQVFQISEFFLLPGPELFRAVFFLNAVNIIFLKVFVAMNVKIGK